MADGTWWNSTTRFPAGGGDGPPATCSTSLAGDLGGFFGWLPAAHEVAGDGTAACFGNSPGSCVTFQDSQSLQLCHHVAGRHAMDPSSEISASGFSSPAVYHSSQSFPVETESSEKYPLEDIRHEFFRDPNSSETAINLHSSFGSPLLGPSCQPNVFSTKNPTFDVNGTLAYGFLREKPKLRFYECNSEEVGNSIYKSVSKKTRIEAPSPIPTFKVRKEKLGDRITALQQLVSPFGKTDTASVLYEAIEYIKFLHEQVQTLSSPYFRNGNQINHQENLGFESGEEGKSRKKELKSRGLCLVPISSTFSVACGEIPAVDFWAPPAFDLNYI